MSDLVSPAIIEGIVGVKRHATEHWGRAVSDSQTVYILHSLACKDSGIDLRRCDYSVALDDGIEPSRWVEDAPVRLRIEDGELLPDPRLFRLGLPARKANEMSEPSPDFVHPLSSGLSDVAEPLRLAPEVEAELKRRLDEMAEARAQAEVSGRDYIIWH